MAAYRRVFSLSKSSKVFRKQAYPNKKGTTLVFRFKCFLNTFEKAWANKIEILST